MSYRTQFEGALQFLYPPTPEQLTVLGEIFGEDIREHPEWAKYRGEFYWIDLALTKDATGIQMDYERDGSNYSLHQQVNLVLEEMRKRWPDFGLEGEMLAQGEDIHDRWVLRIVDGKAERIELALSGQTVTCPHCDGEIELESEVESESSGEGS
jgi:hypothetical protein